MFDAKGDHDAYTRNSRMMAFWKMIVSIEIAILFYRNAYRSIEIMAVHCLHSDSPIML